MNKCFLIGKVVSEPEFNFLFECKNISICNFYIELEKNNVIEAFALDDIADYIYKSINKNDFVNIEGFLINNNKKISIQISNIELI